MKRIFLFNNSDHQVIISACDRYIEFMKEDIKSSLDPRPFGYDFNDPRPIIRYELTPVQMAELSHILRFYSRPEDSEKVVVILQMLVLELAFLCNS